MEDTIKQEIGGKLYPVFEHNHVKKATVFGSYARGDQTEESDIDILVDSGLHGMKFFGLLEEVCSTLDRKVDLIDVSQLMAGGNMEREIKETGVVIYEHA